MRDRDIDRGNATVKGAWYATGGNPWKDLWTLLHPPYTSMVLAFVTIGGCLAPSFHADRLFWLVVAYLLGLGGTAHFLDESRGHPWGTGFSNRTLYLLAAITLLPAMGIGFYYAFALSFAFLAFVIIETFFAFAYNLEWFGGRFHDDLWFSVSWAGLPFLAGYYLQALYLPIWTLLIAASLSSAAGVQITLSRWVKSYRRGGPISALEFVDGSRQKVTTQELIRRPQRALKLIVYSVDLLAIALLIRSLT